MMPNIGYTALVLALVLAVYAVVTAVVSARMNRPKLLQSARNAALGVTALLTLAVGVLVYLLLTRHYQTEYVASVSNDAATIFFRVTALWGGQDGSLLFFSWLMSLFTGTVLLTKWDSDRSLIPYVIAVMQGVLVFFVGVVVTVANPFKQLAFFPPDGQGLNPLLYHWGMIIHPPILYIGYVALVVPFAFAVAALITRQRGDLWMRTTRRWTLIAWLFLSAGLLLGGRWAYDVLGWGGYWGWDPVENAAFIPWLMATPFLHSVVIQENRGMLKRWNAALIMITFCLMIEGSFLTRSGVISSVHTFAQSPIGPLFTIFLAIVFFGCLFLFVQRWDDLKSDNDLGSLLSRESAFLLNNLLFIGVAFVVWWGTHFPLISEAATGNKIFVGPPFFEKAAGPLFAGILLLMGIAPLMPWRHVSSRRLLKQLTWPIIVGLVTMAALVTLTWIRMPGAVMAFGFCAFSLTTTLMEYGRGIQARHKAHGENYFQALARMAARNRRRYGGYLIHLGVILCAIGIIGMEFYQIKTQQNVARGESFTISSPFVGTYELTYRNLATGERRNANIEILEATLDVKHNGRFVGTIVPYREFFVQQQQPMTIPDIHTEFGNELYVILAGWEGTGETASFTAYINPLISWLWFGGIVFVVGTLVAAWPASDPTPRTRTVRVDRRIVAAK
jgi:cytochrome c-type biogenesis protein CcmF